MVEKKLPLAAKFIHTWGVCGLKWGLSAKVGDGVVSHAVADEDKIFHI
jgi:hypothetical protein